MRVVLGTWVAVAIASACVAQTAVANEPSAIESAAPEEITVTGEVPGPGMWKVTRANDLDGHVLWILGNAPPLPKKMKWRSKQVEAAIISSQEVLLGTSVDVEPDEKIGFFKGLSLLPAALGARKNPDDAKLKDLLSADEYARWLRLKKKYLGTNNGIERWRPIFAAHELREEAFDDLRLRESGLVADAVKKLAKDHKIKTTTATVKFPIHTRNIKAKIKEFSREQLTDLACFSTTLDLVETISNKDDMEDRAFAWANGDLEALAKFAPLPDPNPACITAVMGSQVAQELIPSDIGAQLKATWLASAERSLADNRSTFAFLSLHELTTENGQLAALRAKGYIVEEPARD